MSTRPVINTSIMDKRKAPNKFVVDDAVNDDNSVVCLSPKKMEELQLFRGDTVLLAEKDEFESKQQELMGVFNPIMQKLSSGGGTPAASGGAQHSGAMPTEQATADEGPKVEDID